MADLGSLAAGVSQVFSRTIFLQTNTATGIPVPLAILDVVKEEKAEYNAEVTEHPVEFGPEVSDHIQLKSPMLRLKGKISSTPLDMAIAVANTLAGGLSAFTSSQARSNLLNSGISQGAGLLGAALQGNSANLASQGQAGALDAISRSILLTAYENKIPFDVVTKRLRYKNMVIARINFPRNEETGSSLDFEIDLKQVVIVSPLKVQKNILDEKVISSASSSTNLGSQSTQVASAQVSQSMSASSMGGTSLAGKFPGLFS